MAAIATLAAPPAGFGVMPGATLRPSLVLGLSGWLISAAPGSVTFAVVRKLGAASASGRRGAHTVVCVVLVLADVLMFGPPRAAPPSVVAACIGIAAGAAAYWAERLRLAVSHRGALRTSRRSEWTQTSGSAGALGLVLSAGVLASAGAAEEVLFRWYALFIPVWYGAFSLATCVGISSVGYAVLHHDLGVPAMISRGVLGLAAALTVVTTGQLLAVVLAHAVYNVAVHLRPVQYLRVQHAQEGSTP